MQLLIYALFDDDIDWIQFFANFLSSNNLKSFFDELNDIESIIIRNAKRRLKN